ncbi:MAG TPA: hypothetical protein VEY91_08150 [Candidatus Limnocylindria bacterium]|nr:hypothetical protein [Candidatus Limnocylindria bacterium]
MIARVRWVGIASLAVLAAASPCLAADPTGMAPGRGGVGGLLGGSYFAFSDDYSAGAQPRLVFAGNFRYVASPWFRLQFSPGFTWAAYSNTESVPFPDPNFPGDTSKDRYLTLLVPLSFQGQFLVQRGSWHYHLGAGPGLYRVWVENRRKVLKDPDTKDLHRGIYWGATGQIGVERFLKALTSTSIEVSVAGHMVVAERDEQFPSGFNSNLGVVELRVGTNYYFGLDREKKTESPPLPAP